MLIMQRFYQGPDSYLGKLCLLISYVIVYSHGLLLGMSMELFLWDLISMNNERIDNNMCFVADFIPRIGLRVADVLHFSLDIKQPVIWFQTAAM
jgi:hypothetical protein